jgi:hypothetical protein
MTSSVSQELVGYRDGGAIVSYAHPDIESWADIHNGSEGGRLVFMSDSGGHPRYRRTVLRGLVGWDPHWTILCISAPQAGGGGDDGGGSAGGEQPAAVEFAREHLKLCLTLKTPLAIVMTKTDLADWGRVRQALNKVLDMIKAAGRTPLPLKPDQVSHPNLTAIPPQDHGKIAAAVRSIGGYENALSCVPIIFTSAVKGTGIGLVHALLESLPLPPKPTATDLVGQALNPEQPQTLFHVDDTFTLAPSYSSSTPSLGGARDGEPQMGVVVSGYLRFGSLAVGDKVVVGPFDGEDERTSGPSTPGGGGLSMSHPSSDEAVHNSVSASTVKGQWHDAHVVSIHNLRLPVLRLKAGQVGSIGIVFVAPPAATTSDDGDARPQPLRSLPRIRRGMVIAIPSGHMVETGLSLQAASSVTASFEDAAAATLAVGGLVNIYVANVAAAAKVQDIQVDDDEVQWPPKSGDDEDDLRFDNDDDDGVRSEGQPRNGANGQHTTVQVTLELLNHREWIELGSRILVSEGVRRDRSGLDGFLGKVIEIVD